MKRFRAAGVFQLGQMKISPRYLSPQDPGHAYVSLPTNLSTNDKLCIGGYSSGIEHETNVTLLGKEFNGKRRKIKKSGAADTRPPFGDDTANENERVN